MVTSPQVAAAAQDVAAQGQVADIGALHVKVGELRVELSGLQAQWDGLYEQLQVMLKTNPARPGVQQNWADVGVQMAKVKGEIALTEARIAQLGGVTTSTETPPPGPGPGPGFPRIDPDLAIVAGTTLLLALGLPISIAWARRILRRQPSAPAPAPEQTMRLERMEHAIDAMAIEVERISEGQRFVTKILAARPERASTPEASPEPAFVAPAPKVLGAGAVEPISVPLRDRVLQPLVTPH